MHRNAVRTSLYSPCEFYEATLSHLDLNFWVNYPFILTGSNNENDFGFMHKSYLFIYFWQFEQLIYLSILPKQDFCILVSESYKPDHIFLKL